jgi:hypothetical protein
MPLTRDDIMEQIARSYCEAEGSLQADYSYVNVISGLAKQAVAQTGSRADVLLPWIKALQTAHERLSYAESQNSRERLQAP